jgi:hypothetical protein
MAPDASASSLVRCPERSEVLVMAIMLTIGGDGGQVHRLCRAALERNLCSG